MIVVTSLATSRDVIVEVPDWAPGSVRRATRTEVTPGGKPLNVARDCALMGIPVRLVLLADAEVASEVSRCLSPLIEGQIVTSTTPSRTDVCLTDGSGTMTVVNGPIRSPADEELSVALSLLEDATGAGDVVVLAGRQPTGACSSILSLVRRRNARVIVDTSGTDLDTCLAAAPSVAKTTATELAEIRPGRSKAAVWANARVLAPGPTEVVVSDGERGLRAWLADGSRVEVRPPRVHAVNGFGAGDALTAGIAAALAADRPLLDGLVQGTAWAAACVERLGVDFDAGRARALEADVVVESGHGPAGGSRMPADGSRMSHAASATDGR
jgi:fructose-1-phosphate kinase PfkB-like protein